jgi:hypothetical protein
MNFTFIPSPEKTKKFTAVEEGNGARLHLRHLCVGSMNPDLVYYHTNKYKCFINYEFVPLEK